jgi:hypothetical protein
MFGWVQVPVSVLLNTTPVPPRSIIGTHIGVFTWLNVLLYISHRREAR